MAEICQTCSRRVIKILRSSGDGNQGIRSLISHAGFRYGDIVRYGRIQLHIEIIRTAWLPPSVLCVRFFLDLHKLCFFT